MLKINCWAVVVAALVAFLMSSLYYSPLLLGNVWLALDPRSAAGTTPSIGRVLGEIVRTLVITFVIARLIALLGASDWKGVVRLALWLWFGFSGMMWAGAMMWEKTPWQVAAIHSGDWLLKTILIALIVGVWRANGPAKLRGSSQQAGVGGELTC
ncbi:MAG: hypothetical protein JWN63_3092 [Candidatus Acidoferrum typicum]|nr:hypothetical protein [Candidatus Acidoferrum typicum]